MSFLNTSNFQSVGEFSKALLENTEKNETTFLLVDGKLLMVTPAEAARDKIAERIATRLSENPTILHDLQSRLQNDTAEDWD
jgi:hypothetical protein